MNEDDRLRFVAVGDIMLGRGIKNLSIASAEDLLSPEILGILEGDIVTGNLECLVGSAGRPSPTSHSHFQADPEFSESLIRRFDVVTLANNHSGDFGDEAIEETLEWLSNLGVQVVGIGNDPERATAPVTFERGSCKIAIFGATTVGTLTASNRYTVAKPGVELYSRARQLQDGGYICILHLHAGGGDFNQPSPATRRLIGEARAAGFSVVVAHHPHVVQGVDLDSQHAVFYSMGDFVFDKVDEGRGRALVAAINVSASGLLQPEMYLVQRNPEMAIRLLKGKESEEALNELSRLGHLIRTGDSDRAYLRWRGSRIKWLWESVLSDFRAGGFRALRAKVGRIDKHRLRDLVQGL